MKLVYFTFFLFPFLTTAQTDVLLNDFQAGIPVNYSMLNLDNLTPDAAVSEFTSAWISKEDPDDVANLVASSTSYFSPAGQSNRYLITPQLNLGAFGNFLSWQSKSHDATFPESYYVLASRTDNQAASFVDTLKFVYQAGPYWNTDTVNLSDAGLDNESVYIAFVLRSYDGFKLYLDSVHVWKEDPVSVNELTNLDFSVFPNPSNDMIHVSTNQPIDAIRIFDLRGNKVIESKLESISLSKLQSGSYVVEVESNGLKGRKLVVKN